MPSPLDRRSSRRASRSSIQIPPGMSKDLQTEIRNLTHSPWARIFSRPSLAPCVVFAVAACLLLLFLNNIFSTASWSAARGRSSTLVSRFSGSGIGALVKQAPRRNAEGGIADLKRLLLTIVGPPPLKDARGMVAPGAGVNVTVLAVNYAYRELALNFVCSLRRLAMDDNYVILAMDRAMYNFAAEHGVNVFYHVVGREKLAAEDKDIPAGEPKDDDPVGDDTDRGHAFGSPGFVRTSRRKSMLVAEVLSLGYDVFFSDSDVVLYQNPHPAFAEHAEDFIITTDIHIRNNSNLNYNINSGFYFVRARPRTFSALRAIVKYAVRSQRSEQKAFNHVLCGAFKDNIAGPGWRYGTNRCFYRILGGVTTRVLTVTLFPNGSDKSIFDWPPSFIVDAFPGLFALHVNYVSGRDAKIDRIKAIGQWYYNASNSLKSIGGCSASPIEEGMNLEPPAQDRGRYWNEMWKSHERVNPPVEISDWDETGPDSNGGPNGSGKEYDSADGPDIPQLLAHQYKLQQQKQKALEWRQNQFRNMQPGAGLFRPGAENRINQGAS